VPGCPPVPDPGAGRVAAPLGVQAVDLYQVHAFDPWTPLEETVRTLDGFCPRRQDPLLGAVELHRLAVDQGGAPGPPLNAVGPVTLQPQYRLLVRQIEWEIVPAAMDAGLGLLPGVRSAALAVGQVPARPAAVRRHPPGEDPNRGMEATTAGHGARTRCRGTRG